MADGSGMAPSRQQIIQSGSPVILHEDGSSSATSNIPQTQANLTDDSGLVAGLTPVTSPTGVLGGVYTTPYSRTDPTGTIAGSSVTLDDSALVAITVGGTLNDWNPAPLISQTFILLALSSNTTITGIAGGTPGRRVTISINNTNFGNTVTLPSLSASSLAANQIVQAGGNDLVLVQGESVELVYNQGGVWSVVSVAKNYTATPWGTQTYTGNATLVNGSPPTVLGNTTGSAFTLTLPASPSTGSWFLFVDFNNSWGTNNLTIGRNGKNIDFVAADLVLSTSGQNIGLVYDGSVWHTFTKTNAPPSGAAGGDLTGTYPNPTIAAGKVTDAKLVASTGTLANTPPGRELTYNEFTAPVTVSATAEASATTIVTATAFTFDGSTPVIIEFFSVGVNPSASSGDSISFYLFDGGSSIGFLGVVANPTATITGGIVASTRLARRLTPSNASHTYSIRAKRVTANGTVRANTGGVATDMPGYIRITKA